MDITELIQHINSRFPLANALPGDPVGVHITSTKHSIDSILVCLDVTDEVVLDAIEKNVDCIIAFHPLIYSPLQKITLGNRVERAVHQIIQNNIALVAVHTAFDVIDTGTNRLFAEAIGLRVVQQLPTIGVLATSDVPLEFNVLLNNVASACSSSVRYVPSPTTQVSRIAIVAGSGCSFIEDALASNADVFITADVKYHDMLKAKGCIGIIDPGHFEMEQFVPAGIVRALQQIVPPTVQILTTTVNTNPVHYFTSQQILAS